MARVTDDYVASLLAPGHDYDTLEGPSLKPFIAAATARVTWIINNASAYGRTPLDSTMAKEVEGWLAAGLYKMSDQQLKSSQAGRSSGQFRGQDGPKFSESNTYLKTACALDNSMMLAAALDGRFAGATWLGKLRVDQTDYVDRSTANSDTGSD